MSKINTRNRPRSDGSNNWSFYFEIASQNGKRKRLSKAGFKTKAEAQKAGIIAYNEYCQSGEAWKSSEISFADYLDLYLERYCKQELAESTVQNYIKKINLYIKPALGQYKLKAITPGAITDFLNSLKNKGFSRNSLVNVKAILSGAFKYAVAPLQYIQSSPMYYVKLPKAYTAGSKTVEAYNNGKHTIVKRGNSSHIYIKKEWIDKIFEAFPFGHQYYLPLMFGYKLGLRIGEAYALTVEDFDLNAKTVSINKQVQWSEAKHMWFIKKPKYNSTRVLSIDDSLAETIKNTIERINANRKFYKEFYTDLFLGEEDQINTSSGKPFNSILVRENGEYINPRTMQNCSRRIHDMGLPDFDFHSLRHTHATDLARCGAPPKFVQARLGHKSIKTTMEIYQHLTDDQRQLGSELLNNLYSK